MLRLILLVPLLFILIALAISIYTGLKIKKAISQREVRKTDSGKLVLSAIFWMVVVTLFLPKTSGTLYGRLWPIPVGTILLNSTSKCNTLPKDLCWG